MASGSNWGDPLAPNLIGLWHLVFKFNTDQYSFNSGFRIAEKNEADAIAIGVDLAARFKPCMPATASIFDCIISKDNKAKDGRFIPSALGPGTFVATSEETESDYDFAKVALLVRLEHALGGSVPLKLAMLPDEKVTGGALVASITSVVGTPAGVIAASNPADPWETNMNKLLQTIVQKCHYVKSGHVPGETYTYAAFQNAYPKRVSAKKGGRVLSA